MSPRSPHPHRPRGSRSRLTALGRGLLSERFWSYLFWLAAAPSLVLLGAILLGWQPWLWWSPRATRTIEQPPSALPANPTLIELEPALLPSPGALDLASPSPQRSPKPGLAELGAQRELPPVGVTATRPGALPAAAGSVPPAPAASAVAVPPPPLVLANPDARTAVQSGTTSTNGMLLPPPSLPPHPLAIALDRLNRTNPLPPVSGNLGSGAQNSVPSVSAPPGRSAPSMPPRVPVPLGSSYTPPPELQRRGTTTPLMPGAAGLPAAPGTPPSQVVEFDSLPQYVPPPPLAPPLPGMPYSPATTSPPEPRPFSATGQPIGGGEIGTFSNPGVVEQRVRQNP